MNKMAVLTKLTKPIIWIKISSIIILTVVVIKLIFNITTFLLDTDVDLQKDIKIAKEELKLINRRTAQLFALERKLPKLTDQIKLAKVYFESYTLLFEQTTGKKIKNRQQAKITGTIQSMILAMYDMEEGIILIRYNDLTINNNQAILNITIYGKDNG